MIHRLPFFAFASAVWFVVQIGTPTQAQQAQCREEVACESPCANVLDQPANKCQPVCRSIVVCDVEREGTPESRLPSDSLPENRLPKSRLPGSSLPDSSFN